MSLPTPNAPHDLTAPPGPEDCWNQSGVNGNRSCPELARHVHCHHCPVYSAAAMDFLDRPLPEHYRQEWTEHFAQEKRIATPAKTSVVIFRLNHEWLALPTHAFQEIAERRPLHTLPHRRRGIVRGLVNVRGELLICASLQRLLQPDSQLATEPHPTAFDRLLISEWQGQRFAFPVDEVHGVHRFHSADLREPPATIARAELSCAMGVFPWRQHTVGLLNPEPLFATLNRNLA